MKDGSEEKMMPLIWLYWLHAPSLMSIGQSKQVFLAETEFLFLETGTLTLITDTLVAI